jgi:hypothetical protein
MLWLASIAACALTNPRATILDMGLVPDPPVPNQPLDLWVHYQLNGEPVTAGTAT